MRTCYQINLEASFGGGEVYTGTVCRALADLGWRVLLFSLRGARFWQSLDLAGTQLVPVSTLAEIDAHLPRRGALIVTHNALDAPGAERWAARHVLTGFVHMPLFERDPEGLRRYRTLFCVSQHVLQSVRARGHRNAYPEPLYGAADLARVNAGEETIRRGPLYDWDRRKFRDRMLGALATLGSLLPRPGFRRDGNPALGVVSRLTPIKQFPLMFRILAPVLAEFPRLRLEIFGSGGYASVRDLKRALAPAARQVRFWGQQTDVASVYRQLDYVLSGLPEKEALGLNLIEAQSAGVPVLAVRAAPFTETVLEGETGLFFRDPREDGGADFRALLARLAAGAERPRPLAAADHLRRFSLPAFTGRLARALDYALAPAAPA